MNVFFNYTVELGVVIGDVKRGRNIAKSLANDAIAGYFLGLDMTARNIQDEAKATGGPWTVAKGYDTFTPVGQFIEKSTVKNSSDLRLLLEIDGTVKQDGNTKDMIFDIATLIAYISTIMTLRSGDIILTGTPEGVGKVLSGQTLKGSLFDGNSKQLLSTISFPVINRK